MPLTREEVLEKMKDPMVVLLDVSPQKDFDRLHIKDSQNLTLGQNVRSFEAMAVKRFHKQTFFITYGADENGTLGLNAAKLLMVHGFQANHYLGGLKDWSKAGLPVGGTDRSVPFKDQVLSPKPSRRGRPLGMSRGRKPSSSQKV